MVGTIKDEVVGRDYVYGVSGSQVLAVRSIFDVRVEARDALAGFRCNLRRHSRHFKILNCAVYFPLVYRISVVQDLTMQI